MNPLFSLAENYSSPAAVSGTRRKPFLMFVWAVDKIGYARVFLGQNGKCFKLRDRIDSAGKSEAIVYIARTNHRLF